MGENATGQPPDSGPEQESALMSLGEHIEELRSRIIRCLLVTGGAFVVCWLFRQRIIGVITRPHARTMEALHLETSLKFSSYVEPVVAYLKASLIAALLLGGPYIIYQLWAFVAPGLFRHERRKIARVVSTSLVCLLAGVCFGYFLFIPLALHFLLRLSGAQTQPVLMIGTYLSLFFLLTLAMGVAFQMPVVVFYLVRWGIVDARDMQRHRKGVIVAAFILAAFFSPPDPFTQIMMALPLVALYDLGVLAAAPNRATAMSFLKFAGTVALLVGAIGAWFFLWPVGEATALEGSPVVAGSALQPDGGFALRRGRFCSTGPGAALKLNLGGDKTKVFLAGESKVQVHSSSSLSLYGGGILAESMDSGGGLQVRCPVALAELRDGEAEFTIPGEDTFRVTVLKGEVGVKAEGRERLVMAGHTETFHRGGKPTDLSATTEKWQRLKEMER